MNYIYKIRGIILKKCIKKCGKNLLIFGKVFITNKNIIIGDNVQIQPGVMIFGSGKVSIGSNTVIGKDTIIFSNKGVNIGNDVLIAAQSYIIDSDHNIKIDELIRNQGLKSEEVTIGNDVWIGAGAKILKGSKISNGAVIGAQSLVNGYLEEYSINVGIPASKISQRK